MVQRTVKAKMMVMIVMDLKKDSHQSMQVDGGTVCDLGAVGWVMLSVMALVVLSVMQWFMLWVMLWFMVWATARRTAGACRRARSLGARPARASMCAVEAPSAWRRTHR